MSAITLTSVDPKDEDLIRSIIRLADSQRRTLGFLPPAAFADAASKGTLLAATHQGALLAYALYGLPKNEVRLTHLVVHESVRGQGIARHLVDEIGRVHSDRQGIRAKCRRDYGLDGMWLSLGFQPLNEVPGRSLEKKPLVVWHRQHPGHADLFTSRDEPIVRAAIDFNVLRDLYDSPIRQGAQESHSLIADHLDGLLNLVVTSALQSEVSAIKNDERRSFYRRKIHEDHDYAPPESQNVSRCASDLTNRVQRQHPGYPDTRQDKEDVNHIAAAAAAGLTIFTTRDEALISKCGEAALEEFDLRILRPADVVIRIDELVRTDAYRPAALQGTGYTTATIPSSSESELAIFRVTEKGERSQDFLRSFRTYSSAAHGVWERVVTRDPNNNPVSMFVYGLQNGRIEVPFFRVASKHSMAPTLVQQVLSELRRRCVSSDATIIAITDDFVSNVTRRTVLFDGFFERANTLYGMAIKHCGTASEIRAIGESALRSWDVLWDFPSSLNLSPAGIAELESALWPAKVTMVEFRALWSRYNHVGRWTCLGYRRPSPFHGPMNSVSVVSTYTTDHPMDLALTLQLAYSGI